MNSECEKRKLIWKYFWKRKRQEVWDGIKRSWLIISLSLFVSFLLVGIFFPEDSIMFKITGIIIIIIIFSVFLYVTGLAIFSLSKDLIKWLRSNWKLATQDAIKELNSRRKLK